MTRRAYKVLKRIPTVKRRQYQIIILDNFKLTLTFVLKYDTVGISRSPLPYNKCKIKLFMFLWVLPKFSSHFWIKINLNNLYNSLNLYTSNVFRLAILTFPIILKQFYWWINNIQQHKRYLIKLSLMSICETPCRQTGRRRSSSWHKKRFISLRYNAVCDAISPANMYTLRQSENRCRGNFHLRFCPTVG